MKAPGYRVTTYLLVLGELNCGSRHLLAAASSPRKSLLELGLSSSLEPKCLAAEGTTGSEVPV